MWRGWTKSTYDCVRLRWYMCGKYDNYVNAIAQKTNLKFQWQYNRIFLHGNSHKVFVCMHFASLFTTHFLCKNLDFSQEQYVGNSKHTECARASHKLIYKFSKEWRFFCVRQNICMCVSMHILVVGEKWTIGVLFNKCVSSFFNW